MRHLQVINDYLIEHDIDMAQLVHDNWVKYELTIDEVENSNKDANMRKSVEQTPGNDVKRIRLVLIKNKKHCSCSSVGSSSPLECIRREINKYTSVTDTDDIEDPLV